MRIVTLIPKKITHKKINSRFSFLYNMGYLKINEEKKHQQQFLACLYIFELSIKKNIFQPQRKCCQKKTFRPTNCLPKFSSIAPRLSFTTPPPLGKSSSMPQSSDQGASTPPPQEQSSSHCQQSSGLMDTSPWSPRLLCTSWIGLQAIKIMISLHFPRRGKIC